MPINISLAPFLGLTSRNYRQSYTAHFPGLDRVFAPFISGVHPEKANISKFDDVLPVEENLVETVPQFISIDSREIITIAEVLGQHGYSHINWNMGCPFSRLANKKRGCGILPYPDQIEKLLDEVMTRIPLKLSIKTRLGYTRYDELARIIDIFNRYPLHELIIHPRIGTQLYKGNTRLDEFAYCLTKSKIPVTFNGDIYHSRRLTELRKLFPEIRSWMIGRGALINPFLASQIKGIVLPEDLKRKMMHDFHNDLFMKLKASTSNERRMLGQLKAIWYYMSGVYSGSAQILKSLKVCQDSHTYLTFANKLMEQPFASDDEIEHHWKKELRHVGE